VASLATSIEGFSSHGMAEIHVRLFKSCFSGLPEEHVFAIYKIIASGVVVSEAWLNNWLGILGQLRKCQFTGQAIYAELAFLDITLDGNQILHLFTSLNVGGLQSVHADTTLRLLTRLHTAGTTGTQIQILLHNCLTTLTLLPHQTVTILDGLMDKKLNGTQICSVITALCAGGLVASRTRAKIVKLMDSVFISTEARTHIVSFFTLGQAPLTAVQAIELSFGLSFGRLCSLLFTGGGPAATLAGLNACVTIDLLRLILEQADTSEVPIASLIVLLNAVTHVPATAIAFGEQQAHNRTGRVVKFISLAKAALAGHQVNNRDWAGMVGLFATFRAANRMPLGALAAPGQWTRVVDGATLKCSGQRIIYFLRAHTLRFCSFRIADRTKDDITFFGGNGHSPAILQGLVTNMATSQPGVLKTVIDNADEDITHLSVQLVGNYEAGVVKNHDGTYSLIHFMPNNLYPGVVVIHKALLLALGFLLADNADA